MAIKYFLSCEGDTERWYFEWLQKTINDDPRTTNKVEFIYKNVMPSSFTKSNHGTFTVGMLKDSCFCRIQDIEDYSNDSMNQFNKLLESNKEAKKSFKKYNFFIGYSNYTFEIWMISHRATVKTVAHRKDYYKQINSAYNKTFSDNNDYKHEKKFKSLLDMLSLEDVIKKAIPECDRIRAYNKNYNSKKRKLDYGFEYYMCDPDTTLHEFVKKIIKDAGII